MPYGRGVSSRTLGTPARRADTGVSPLGVGRNNGGGGRQGSVGVAPPAPSAARAARARRAGPLSARGEEPRANPRPVRSGAAASEAGAAGSRRKPPARPTTRPSSSCVGPVGAGASPAAPDVLGALSAGAL
jgi:hypothetical protein